jgi:hypothetical protein
LKLDHQEVSRTVWPPKLANSRDRTLSLVKRSPIFNLAADQALWPFTRTVPNTRLNKGEVFVSESRGHFVLTQLAADEENKKNHLTRNTVIVNYNSIVQVHLICWRLRMTPGSKQKEMNLFD